MRPRDFALIGDHPNGLTQATPHIGDATYCPKKRVVVELVFGLFLMLFYLLDSLAVTT